MHYQYGVSSVRCLLQGRLTACVDLQEYSISDLVVVSDKLPGDTWHGWRYMKMSKDGHIIIPIGINCNSCEQNTTAEGIKFGAIYKLNPKSGKITLIADGE